MTRIFTEGAEAGDLVFWTTVTGSVSNTTSGARIGGRAFFYGNAQSSSKILPSTYSEFYWRIALKPIENTVGIKIAWLSGAIELGSIRRNGNTGFDIYTGTATLQVSGTKTNATGDWMVLEIHVKISDAGGVIEFKQDGVLQPSFSGDTKPGTEATINTILVAQSISGTTFEIDDMAFNDTSGTVDNSWCGDAHIYGLTPNGNGTTNNFTGSDGNSTDNYLLVDEVPSNSDTDYVQSATSAHKDLYAFSNLPTIPAGASVVRVIVETRARELTAAGDSILLGVRSGGVESFSSGIVLGVSYQVQKAEFLTDPATGVAWLQTAVDALEAGVKNP